MEMNAGLFVCLAATDAVFSRDKNLVVWHSESALSNLSPNGEQADR
jgi:hypothetical protein